METAEHEAAKHPEVPVTAIIEGIRASITEALAAFQGNPAAATTLLRNLQKKDRAAFAGLALRHLGSCEPSPASRALASVVASDALVIDLLLMEDQLPLSAAIEAVRQLVQADPAFEVRAIRKILQNWNEVSNVPAAIALRLLQLLDKASDCSRLIPHLMQFMRHSSERVRSKSVLLVGRGNLNLGRTRQFASHGEARVRANAVESLWNHNAEGTHRVLQECSADSHPRVAVNALVGLCRLGDSNAPERLIALAGSENPAMRAAAAWGMAHTNLPEAAARFRVTLEALAQDPSRQVQEMARRSLDKFRSPPADPLAPPC